MEKDKMNFLHCSSTVNNYVSVLGAILTYGGILVVQAALARNGCFCLLSTEVWIYMWKECNGELIGVADFCFSATVEGCISDN